MPYTAVHLASTPSPVGTADMLAEAQLAANVEQAEGHHGHLLQLPQDVLARIGLLLPPLDVERVSCTCKTLQRVMKDESVWQV